MNANSSLTKKDGAETNIGPFECINLRPSMSLTWLTTSTSINVPRHVLSLCPFHYWYLLFNDGHVYQKHISLLLSRLFK
ncbi:hypothetical protein ABKN59_002212 [Abortiporus biennis]